MGAIQQAINQITNSALGAAVGVKAAEIAQSQKEEKQFNAAMQATELPVQEAELKSAAAEAQKDLALEQNTLEYQKKVGEIYDVKNKILKTDKGEMNPDRYEAIAEHRIGQARADSVDKENLIKLNYSKEKIQLSKKIHEAQIEAKKEQSRLIADRLEKLKGGKK